MQCQKDFENLVTNKVFCHIHNWTKMWDSRNFRDKSAKSVTQSGDELKLQKLAKSCNNMRSMFFFHVFIFAFLMFLFIVTKFVRQALLWIIYGCASPDGVKLFMKFNLIQCDEVFTKCHVFQYLNSNFYGKQFLQEG